ncbi:MAG TPA: hypothetical protein VHA82_01945 [Ramlibacter sp.]|uniref:hypothetical protein n=1 Tax=Ramlibacter sp. TaxID=1917967 RepID=UPI002CF8B595|nr:hypothetical protein [Ramlibacter sp.]HVZ42542.1 hypothetical protein [Ramlibacter sp.]
MIRALKWIGLAFALCVLSFAAVLFALHRWLATDDFRQRMQREASQVLGVPLQAGALSIDVWPLPAVAIDRLEIGSQPPLTLARVELRPEWRPLLAGRLAIATLVVRDAVLPEQGIAALVAAARKDAAPRAATSAEGAEGDVLAWLPRRMLFDHVAWIDSQGARMLVDAEARLDDAGLLESASFKVLEGRFAGAKGQVERAAAAWPVRLDVGGGKVSGTLQLKPGTKNARLLQGEFDTAGVEVSALTAPSRTLTGKLDAHTSLHAEFHEPGQLADAMQTQTRFTIRDAVVRGLDLAEAVKTVGMSRGGATKLDTLAGQVTTQGRVVHLTNLVASSGALAATGNVTMTPDKRLNGRVDVALAASRGTVGVPLSVGGTLDAPNVTLSRGALVGAAVGTLLAPGVGTGAGASVGGKIGDRLKGLFGR